MAKFTEEDVELAERYAAALERIESLGGVFSEDDAKAADEHLATLQRIEELADKD